MATEPDPVTFGAIKDEALPLAVLVHGFPDTPHTWRRLGPQLAESGYRVVAPWLHGYRRPAARSRPSCSTSFATTCRRRVRPSKSSMA
jgi:pimeloyl-ACP methyl ester carboxylesterase